MLHELAHLFDMIRPDAGSAANEAFNNRARNLAELQQCNSKLFK